MYVCVYSTPNELIEYCGREMQTMTFFPLARVPGSDEAFPKASEANIIVVADPD